MTNAHSEIPLGGRNAALAPAPSLAAWPSPVFVGDKLPLPFEDVLMDNGDQFCVGYLRRDGKFYADQDGLEFDCQYWLPLPPRGPNAEMTDANRTEKL